MQTWIDGDLLADPEAPAVPVLDHGLTVGDGVFEAVKVVDNAPFALDLHLDRLVHSAEGLGLGIPDLGAVRSGVAAVLAADPLALGRLRITMTAGSAPPGSGRVTGRPRLIVVAVGMDRTPASTTVATVPWPRNERGATAGLKTTSYAENVIALAEAQRRGASEAIFANTRGHLCEGTGTNVFYVVHGELRTPTLGSGCLAGVTRGLVLAWVGATEIDEPIEVVRAASEVFLVSTTRDVQAVSRWDDVDLPSPGPTTEEAARVWRERESELLVSV